MPDADPAAAKAGLDQRLDQPAADPGPARATVPDGPVEVVAEGRDAWVGWIELRRRGT
jgi:hypothetical protein